MVPGRAAVAASCDVLVVDGFVDGSAAKALCTHPSTTAPSGLRPGGVMVANFMSDDGRIEPLQAIEESFGRRPTLLLAEERGQFCRLRPRNGPPRIAWAELKARARAAQRLFDLSLEDCFPSLKHAIPTQAGFLPYKNALSRPQYSGAGPAQVLSLGDATAIIVGLSSAPEYWYALDRGGCR